MLLRLVQLHGDSSHNTIALKFKANGSYFFYEILFQIHKPMQMSKRLVSECLLPAMKTVIQYDCMRKFANIMTATIVDMDGNLVIKSFGIKQGIELKETFLYLQYIHK